MGSVWLGECFRADDSAPVGRLHQLTDLTPIVEVLDEIRTALVFILCGVYLIAGMVLFK